MKKFRIIIRHWLPIAALVGFLLFVFWPVLAGGVFLDTGVVFSDLWQFNYPLKDWYRELLTQGKLPFWTNLIGNGYPLFAELQIGALYPWHLLLFGLFPMPLAYHLNIYLHFVFAALFTYAFCRVSLQRSQWAAVLAGIVYALSGYFVTRIHQINILQVAALFPLVFLVVERLVTTRRVAWVFVGSGVLAFQILAGYVELFFYTAMLSTAFFVFIAFFFTERSSKKAEVSSLKLVGFLLLMYVLGVGISAVQLLPTWELTQLSQRAEGLSIESAQATAWPLDKLVLFVNSRAYDLYAPAPDDQQLTATQVNIPALYGYVGFLPLILALLGVVMVRKRYVVIFTIFMIGALVYGMGKSTQLFAIAWEIVPGLKYFRFPVKILFFIEFCLGVLAAYGLDFIRSSFEKRKLRVIQIGVVSAVVLVIVVGDLYINNVVPIMKVVPGKEWLSKPEAAAFLQTEIDPLKNRIYSHGTNNMDYATTRDFSYQKDFQNILPVDFNMLYRIPSNREWVALFLERQQGLNDTRTSLDPEKGSLGLPKKLKKSLALQSVRFLVADLPIEDPDLVLVKEIPFSREVDHLAHFAGAGGARTVRVPASATYIYENTIAYPRAMLVASARGVADGEAALRAVLSEDFDPRKEVILEKEVVVDGKADEEGMGLAQIVSDRESELEVSVESETSGYLVLNDSYYPGWRAEVDGEPVEILRANYAFRAVPVEAGEHVVRFSFEPTHWRVGIIISIISLVVTVGGLSYTLLAKR